MLSLSVYPFVSLIVFSAVMIFAVALGLRMLFSFTDPNPFGLIGKFAYRLRRATDRFVTPFATFLFMWRIDKKWAPILMFLVAAFLAFFGLRIIGDTFFIIDGLVKFSVDGNVKAIIGLVLYTLLSIYILFIFLRIISSWFVYTKQTFFRFRPPYN